jgi:hypothetical protein
MLWKMDVNQDEEAKEQEAGSGKTERLKTEVRSQRSPDFLRELAIFARDAILLNSYFCLLTRYRPWSIPGIRNGLLDRLVRGPDRVRKSVRR